MAESSRGPVVSVGPFAEHNVGHYLSEGDPAFVPDVAWNAEDSNLTPLGALCWRSRYVPLMGRDDDVRALLAWARSGPGVKARILVGDAGSGKTRLAAEVADMLRQEGWSAGFACWSRGQVWHTGEAGTLLIVDDPFDIEGRVEEEIERGVGEESADARVLRLLVLRRVRGSWSGDAGERCSTQELRHLSVEDAAAVHYAARSRYSAERPVPFPKQRFEEWAASEPSVRLRPLYAIASALSLGHPPWDPDFPAKSRRTLVGLAQATHNVFDQHGKDVGLAPDVLPLIAAIAEVRGGLDESDLRRLAERTALTESDADAFVERVRCVPAWRHDRLHASSDSLPRAEFVRIELREALDRGLGSRVAAALSTANRLHVAELDRSLSNVDVSVDVCDRLALDMRLADERWLPYLDMAPRAGSFLGRLALRVAEREAPRLPVTVGDPATNEEHASQLVTLAREQRRESGASAAVEAADGAAVLYRALARKSDVYESDLFAALRFLGECLQDANSTRAGEIWKECVDLARGSRNQSDLLFWLRTLGECELASETDRIDAVRALAAIHEEAGRSMHFVLALEYLALLVPLDEAASLVDHAAYVRANLGLEAQLFLPSAVLEQLFERFKELHQETALVVARLQVADRRSQQTSDSYPRRVVEALRLGESLENVAAVAAVFEARDALRDALDLFRRVFEETAGRFGSTRVQRVDDKLRELENRG